ncbi:MliC family protein [Pseudomonas denitrificans (nom. rej.)]|uniref:Lysozyme inhibitor n=1 Tax=Pseudomonas denitrificans TaxID=43306 RepID=A0A9X7R5X8_PSEDE|nr:MliC family protein [Pseudomonas denitrificans (nom. rej.)]QEY73988.1 lysozyme inhibitor [Pseudomonas denitrificans (nom. rej.)]
MLRYLVPALALALVAGCSSHSTGGNSAVQGGWNHWVCDSKAEVRWRYVDPSKSVVDLKLGEDDVVHHLEEEPGGSGAFYSDGLIGLSIKGDQGLVYWVESNDLIGRGCKAH